MKDVIKELRPLVTEKNNQLGDFSGRILFVKSNLYKSLASIQLTLNMNNATNLECDAEKIAATHYKDHLDLSAKVLYNYLSIGSSTFQSKASFVDSFYQAYIVFPIETIVSSEYETSSLLYDASIESSLARMLAVGYKMNNTFPEDLRQLVKASLI